MPTRKKLIPLNGIAELVYKLAQDYEHLILNKSQVPSKFQYNINYYPEHPSVTGSARKAALAEIKPQNSLKKFAFDTRRYDQETTRNPRANLQTWLRSDQFIDDEMQGKINIFAKMLNPLIEIKQSFGNQPEWHDSYTRVLLDTVERVLRIKEADLDIYRPQLAYLEQLMFTRYRLSMDELSRMSEKTFKDQILKKDESLLKRGTYLHMTANQDAKMLTKDGNQNITQDSIVNAIFGSNFRRDGEKTVTRTITITIKDSAED